MYISALSACMPLFPLRHQVSPEMIGSSHVIAGNGIQDLWKSSQLADFLRKHSVCGMVISRKSFISLVLS